MLIEFQAADRHRSITMDDIEPLFDHPLMRKHGFTGMSTSRDPDDVRYFGGGFSVSAPDAMSALRHGLRVWTEALRDLGVPRWPTVRLEAIKRETWDRESDAMGPPDIVGVHEIAQMLGVSRQRASQLTQMRGFPEPFYKLAHGPSYLKVNIEVWAKNWNRNPGRRPRTDA